MKLYRGPVNHAAGAAAYIPTGYLAVITFYLNLWTNIYLQFVSFLIVVSTFIILHFFFEKRLKKTIPLFKGETNRNRVVSIIITDLFIVVSCFLILYLFFKKVE